MHLRGKTIRFITAADLFALRDEKVRESRHLDYKQELPGKQDSERKEFLKDVTAMANAGGGVLLYGIAEKRVNGKKTGFPEEIAGVEGHVTDDVLSLEDRVFRRINTNRFDRDPIFIPAVTLQDTSEALDEVLLPAFDMLWQAAGISECFLRRLKGGW